MSRLLPKFLEEDVPCNTIMAKVALFTVQTFPLERKTFHIVMLVPEMDYDPEKYPDVPVRPHLFAEYTYGDRSTWKHDFANIARHKALQLWHDRSDGSDSKAHLLFPGDTPHWGGVKRDGIAVACEGAGPHFDRMIASMIADACIALADDAKVKWMRGHPNVDFLD